MIAAPKLRLSAEVAIAGIISCAEPVPSKVRLTFPRKKWVKALGKHGGVWIQAPV